MEKVTIELKLFYSYGVSEVVLVDTIKKFSKTPAEFFRQSILTCTNAHGSIKAINMIHVVKIELM